MQHYKAFENSYLYMGCTPQVVIIFIDIQSDPSGP